MSLRQFADRHPVAVAVGCAALQFVLTIAILEGGLAFVPKEAFGKVKLIAFASTILLPLILAQALGLWGRIGAGLPKLRFDPIFLAALVLTAAPFLVLGVRAPAEGVGNTVIIQLFNAFGEELLFRGVIFALLIHLPMWRAIVLNGVLFGAMHLIHGVMDGDWKAAAGQALVTAICGMMFTAVRYSSRSLWAVVALHMLLNLAMLFSNLQDLNPTGSMLAERWANVVELAIVAWVLARGATPRRAAFA